MIDDSLSRVVSCRVGSVSSGKWKGREVVGYTYDYVRTYREGGPVGIGEGRGGQGRRWKEAEEGRERNGREENGLG